MQAMLSYVNPFRHRFTLRLNDDDKSYRIRDFGNNSWVLVGDGVYGSSKATIKGSFGGQRIDLFSAPGHPQRIVLANSLTNQEALMLHMVAAWLCGISLRLSLAVCYRWNIGKNAPQLSVFLVSVQ